VVRREVVAAKVARARAWLNGAASALQSPLATFLSDPKSRDLSLFYLFLAIQECIDLAAHWVADEGRGAPDDAGSAFDLLADRGVIDREGINMSDRQTGRGSALGARGQCWMRSKNAVARTSRRCPERRASSAERRPLHLPVGTAKRDRQGRTGISACPGVTRRSADPGVRPARSLPRTQVRSRAGRQA
jgi:hypothetical protein